MAINFSQMIYTAGQNTFSRPVTFTPLASQPNASPYGGRGIYDTEPVDVLAEEGSIFSDSRIVLDILDSEFDVLPLQGDRVFIPAHIGMPELGNFEVIDTRVNGGGETTLALRRVVVAKPA